MRVGPFSEHIFDAIVINLKRMFPYARLSYGLSLPASLGLIGFEIVILPLAWFYDLNEIRWKKRGHAILTNDFISMSDIPVFSDRATDIPRDTFKFEEYENGE